MKKVLGATQELILTIQNSVAYKEYHRLYTEIEKNPDLLQKVNEYRKRRFEVQVSDTADYSHFQDELQNQFKDIHSNELTLEFLNAERHFSNLIKQVNHSIIDSVSMDIGFLGE